MLNREQIKEIIPHRSPFLLLDCVEELKPGVSAKGYWDIKPENPVFEGHFPGNPVLPGVLMIESMAQLGAVALLSMPEFKGKTALFGGIKNARFKRMVRPGDRLQLDVDITTIRGPMGVGKATCKVDGELATRAEFTFMVDMDT